MANNEPKNVKLGVCKVFYGGVDLGFTKGGVEVTVETETHEVQVDQYGNTPIDEIVMGRTASVSVPLAETTLDNLVAVMPGAILVTDPSTTDKSVIVPTGVGASLLALAKEMVLIPRGINGELDLKDAFRIPKAATPGALNYSYMFDQERVFNCNFKAYPVIEDNNEVLFQVGAVEMPAP